jgi:hypothetical protein
VNGALRETVLRCGSPKLDLIKLLNSPLLRRQETIRCRRSLYHEAATGKTQDCHFDHKPGGSGLFDGEKPVRRPRRMMN